MKRTLIYMFAAMSLVGSSCSGDWLNLNPSTSVTTPQAMVKMFKRVSAREPENVYHLIMSLMLRQMMP